MPYQEEWAELARERQAMKDYQKRKKERKKMHEMMAAFWKNVAEVFGKAAKGNPIAIAMIVVVILMVVFAIL